MTLLVSPSLPSVDARIASNTGSSNIYGVSMKPIIRGAGACQKTSARAVSRQSIQETCSHVEYWLWVSTERTLGSHLFHSRTSIKEVGLSGDDKGQQSCSLLGHWLLLESLSLMHGAQAASRIGRSDSAAVVPRTSYIQLLHTDCLAQAVWGHTPP